MVRTYTTIDQVSRIPEDTKFIVIHDDSYSEMGHDYGPPDPPPRMETTNFARVLAFNSEENLTSWIKENSKERYFKRFKVIPYAPLTVSTSVSISLS